MKLVHCENMTACSYIWIEDRRGKKLWEMESDHQFNGEREFIRMLNPKGRPPASETNANATLNAELGILGKRIRARLKKEPYVIDFNCSLYTKEGYPIDHPAEATRQRLESYATNLVFTLLGIAIGFSLDYLLKL